MSSSTDLSLNILLNAQDVSASSTMSAVGSVIKNLASGNVMGAVGIAAAAAAAAIAGIGVASVQAAGDFQQATTKIASYAGLSGSALSQMTNSLMDMSTQVGQSPTQLANALYPIVSAGYQASDALNILKLSAETAAASGANTATVADGLTTVLKAFNFPAKDASAVMDVLNQSVSNAKTTFPELSAVIGKLSLSASSAHVPFVDMNAALDVLTTHGFPSVAQASNALGNLFTQVGVKTDALQKHAQQLGLQGFDATKFSAMNLSDKIDYLNKVTGGNQGEILKMLGGSTQALKAFNALSGGAKDYAKDLSALNNSQGKTASVFQAATNTYNFQVQQMGAAFDKVKIAIGNQLLPILGKFMGWVTPIITGFADWFTKSNILQNAFQTLGGALGGLQPLITGIGQFVQTVFLPAWQGLVQTVQTQLVPAWNNLMVTLQPLLPYFQQFAIFLAGTVGASIILVVALISGLIGALGGLMNGIAIIIKGIVIFVQGAIQFLSGIITFFADLFTGKWDKLGGDLANIWGGIVKMFQGSWVVIEGIFVGAIDVLIGLINGFVAGVMGPLNSILSAAHQATISVGQIPMLTVNTSTGGLATMPVYKSIGQSSSGTTAKSSTQSTASQIQQLTAQIQQQQQNMSQILASTPTPTTGAVNTASGTATTQSAKQQQAAQVAAMKLSDTQNKAIATSGSSQVQALVDASKQAAAQGNMSLAKYDAAKAATLANQQKAAATKAASAAAKAARAAKAASDRAAKASASQKKHLQTLAAAAQRHAATLAAHAAKLAQSANNHSALISAISASTNQITTNQCAAAGVSSTPTALGVALPDYVNQTGYTQSAPIIQQAPAPASSGQTNVTVHVHTDSKDPKDHGQKVAEEVKKHMAKMLRGQSVAPRFTSGGIR